MRHKVQDDDNLLVWIHSLRNVSEWGHAIKTEQLEGEYSASPTIYLQESQCKLCCNITKLSRTLFFGHFGIGKQ